MIKQVEYFDKAGKTNASSCLKLVQKLIDEGYSHVVVATTSGETGLLFGRALKGKKVNLVAVTHNVGYLPNKDECALAARQEMESLGVKIFTGTIITRGIEAALMKKHQGVYPAYVVAETLRLLGQGMKVAVEITVEACDAGLVPEGTEVVAVAGTGRGADTVAIIEARPSDRFFDVRVKQIVAKPL